MEDDFQLFSSLRYDPALHQVPARNFSYAGWNWANTSPIYMLDYHRDRMLRAATHWGWDAAVEALKGDAGLAKLRDHIMNSVGETQQGSMRVRISIGKEGELVVSSGPVPETTLANLLPERLPPPDGEEACCGEPSENIPSKSPSYEVLVDGPETARSEHTHFKTTKRAAYDGARQRAQINLPDMKEVLIVNEANGAVMEGSITTPYFWRGGRWVTPIVSQEYSLEKGSGGQNGTSRRWALERYVTSVRPSRAKVKAIPNSNYQRHGTKSYVSVLNRFGFQPTKPGPYFQKFAKAEDGVVGTMAPGVKQGHVWQGIFKKIKDDDKPGEVTAEDQQNDAEYLCEVSIGTEPQKIMLDFDTGSADLWVSHKSFNPDKSSTFKLAEDMSWKIQYGDGSSASGTVGTDIVSIGGLTIKDQAIEVAKHMSAQFSEGTMDGLLGLAFRKINTIRSHDSADPQPTPVDNMITQDDIPKEAELFTSAMYSSRDHEEKSFYSFGWIDEDLVKQSGEEIAWTKIDNSEGFWMFMSESATVNGKKIPLSDNRAIADTGTTLALVSDEVCDALYAQIKGAEYSDEYQGYTIPRSTNPAELPDFSVAVGDKEFVIQKEDLLFAPADDNVWYGGVQSRGENPFDILGDAFLKSIYAIWDQGNTRFGAVPKIEKIPIKRAHRSAADRPEVPVKQAYGDISSTFE
ncbi:aspartic peptidase domain-containing protein [Chaetomidium leptoderma]|uniref:Aspartic peptidase domain-containing protein n=1 Tax=Chaetomidium leptoderma TaxID=669021 RepID=A0AAN6VGP7_9PEZI|nr:aspartic peptidase domain-containing protein [Chaetomidium leptoderma]